MFEWSETDVLIRYAVRAFIDKEIRPNLDVLDRGELPPYPIIRKLFSQFGIDAMGAEAVDKMLVEQRARGAAAAGPRGSPSGPGVP
ncbi:hypothetical protein [Nocardia sp. 2TAF39]|uniref:hypothetical protein n=1 Tax=unclassified Nocardia TaxID=2637762 RepID=UPI003F9A9A47